MSTIATPTLTAPGAVRLTLKVTQRRVLRSELTKFRSLRSTIYTLLTAVVLMIGIGAVVSAATAGKYHGFRFNPITPSLTGVTFAVVAFGVLGVLVTSGEYSTGMIRSSLTAVPRRLPVLWSKLAVCAGVIFPVSLIASFTSFFVGQALLNSHHLGVSITAPGALRSVVGAALYVTVAGMIGVALGGLFRNTAAGIATFTVVFFVIPPLVKLLPSSISGHLVQYLPNYAGAAVWGGASDVSHALAPWTGFALFCGYAAVAIAVAAWRLRRSDA